MVLRREQINHKKPTHLHSNHKYSDNNDAGSNYALSHKSKFSDGELHRSKSAKQLERSLSHSPVILRRDDGRS
jgi:hypothetical protein